ncbi:MAG: extracellular solute-binding protein [Gammaproteobacteria bacterium]|nr:extracellular solute-binding protein [Gammaproteobacteria bacterium]
MSKSRIEDTARSFLAGNMSRRAFIARMSRLGVGAAASAGVLSAVANRAWAQDFNWRKHAGKTIKVLLPKHPYATYLTQILPAFTELTGIRVEHDTLPEGPFFEKKTSELNTRSATYDAFMDGIMFAWGELLAGQIADLNEFIGDPGATSPAYNWEGILPNMRASCAWSGIPGDRLGGPGSRQMLVPLGWEGYCVSYNREIFDAAGVTPPENLPAMRETSAKIKRDVGGSVHGISVRGAANWGTIHPGYLSGFTSYGGQDFRAENGKIRASMNSPQGKKFTQLWIDMVRESGPPKWTEYIWYEVGQDLGAGVAGMIFDADILGFFQNTDENNPAAGKIAFAPFAANPAANGNPKSNLWVWSLGMNNYSANKEAAWFWIQYNTMPQQLLAGVRDNGSLIDPVRGSIWNDAGFIKRLQDDYPGYLNQYEKTVGECQVYFTAHPLFAQSADKWSRKLHEIYARQVTADEGLDQLAEEINADLNRAGYLL